MRKGYERREEIIGSVIQDGKAGKESYLCLFSSDCMDVRTIARTFREQEQDTPSRDDSAAE